jgi:DNA-binding TFAR19-related protein (PDSD5 family)
MKTIQVKKHQVPELKLTPEQKAAEDALKASKDALKAQIANELQTPEGRERLAALADEIATNPYAWADRYR